MRYDTPCIALYGYGLPQLKPILSWVSSVVHIRTIEAGTPISYGAAYVSGQKTCIAVVPVGYAEGYPREFVQVPQVLINGQRCPVVGRVCMNQLMVDIGLEHNVHLFDKVYLIHDRHLDADKLAKASGTISYRILTSIDRAIPRRYVDITE